MTNPIRPSKATPAEQEQLLAGAKAALAKGWFVFASPYKSKAAYEGSHGSLDARNNASILEWWELRPDSNPCIRLDMSGLTILDADHGLSSMEQAEAWAERNGLGPTYIVSTGRPGGGFHFYCLGVRTIKDVTGKFELDGVSGDIKHRGHVVAAGGLHKSGATYKDNGRSVAPLTDFIRDYQDPTDKEDAERAAQRAERNIALYGTAVAPELPKVPWGERYPFLRSRGGDLRRMGLGEEAIYLGLWDICRRRCEDGEAYSDDRIRGLAEWLAAQPCNGYVDTRTPIKTGLKIRKPTTMKGLVMTFITETFPADTPMSMEGIVSRIHIKFPGVHRRTCQRAAEAAGFKKIGPDPTNGMVKLWVRTKGQSI